VLFKLTDILLSDVHKIEGLVRSVIVNSSLLSQSADKVIINSQRIMLIDMG